MKPRALFLAIVLVGMLLPCQGLGAMTSDNYSITTTVMSGGGGPMGSTSYRLNATLGQPSPLIDPVDPPWSTNYGLLTGFWYTLGAGSCRRDIEPLAGDGDVDGADLAEFLNAFSIGEVASFALAFGRTGCLP